VNSLPDINSQQLTSPELIILSDDDDDLFSLSEESMQESTHEDAPSTLQTFLQ
jgi:hypothetical protein